jgi:hypothetical protein
MLGTGSRCALVVALVVSGACTEPVHRETPLKLELSVDADRAVRAMTSRVDIVVEGEVGGDSARQSKTWKTIYPGASFRPSRDSEADWPWSQTIDPPMEMFSRFSLKATARDGRDAVIARVQAVRDLAYVRKTGLRVHFDSDCLRGAESLCEEGFTCDSGQCVDATQIPRAAEGGKTQSSSVEPNAEVAGKPEDGVAKVGDACVEGPYACAEHGSRTPLHCEGRVWIAQPECEANQRCNTANDAQRGACLPISDACSNRTPNVAYCDGETMYVCVDLIASEMRTCDEHEQCVPEGDSARCGCQPGFTKDERSGRCREPEACGPIEGGCDPLTKCMGTGCTECPPGYAGTGETMCVPELRGLVASAGTFDPPFAPDVYAYHLKVPLLAVNVTFTPAVPDGATLTVNDRPLEAAGTWKTPMLPLGTTTFSFRVSASSAANREYTVTVERSGAERNYIKADTAGLNDQFGFIADVSGDTLMTSAFYEDSSATGINGNQSNDGATSAGAVYLYVPDGSTWKEQAYVKPNDTAAGDFFGARAELEGDTLVVAALHVDIFNVDSSTRPGAVYTFTRSADKWTQVQRMAGSHAQTADGFGSGLALDGDTLAVGAYGAATSVARSGLIYIYERSGGQWVERQILQSSMPFSNSGYAAVIALDDDLMVVGAADDGQPLPKIGSAEVFVRRNGMWKFLQRLQPSTLDENANFGFAAAVRGNRIAIGAPRTHPLFSTAETPPGEVYVFEVEGDVVKQAALLRAANPRPRDSFGGAVALSDTILAVGALGDSSGARGIGGDSSRTDVRESGAVYLFAPTPEGWVSSAYVKPHNPDEGAAFGWAIAMEGDTLAVTAKLENAGARGIDPDATVGSVTGSGALYVFR